MLSCYWFETYLHIANPINPDSRVGKEKVNLQFADDVELGEWKCIRIINPTVNIMDHFTDHKKKLIAEKV